MTDTSNRGLGSDNMDEQTKHDIQSEGGKASHGGGQNSQQSGGQSTSSNSGNQGLGSENMDPEKKMKSKVKAAKRLMEDRASNLFALSNSEMMKDAFLSYLFIYLFLSSNYSLV